MSEFSSLSEMPPAPLPAKTGRPAVAGALGGSLGGVLAGSLGGAFGGCIESIAPPEPSTILQNALVGAAAWGLAGGVVGVLAGPLIGRWRGCWTAFRWLLLSAFLAALVSDVEVAQVSLGSGVFSFLLGMLLLVALFAAEPWLKRALWRLRWLLVGWLVLCLAGEAYSRLRPRSFTDVSSTPSEPVVELGYSRLSGPLGCIATPPFLDIRPRRRALAPLGPLAVEQ
jgi:hypothetical protein